MRMLVAQPLCIVAMIIHSGGKLSRHAVICPGLRPELLASAWLCRYLATNPEAQDRLAESGQE